MAGSPLGGTFLRMARARHFVRKSLAFDDNVT